MTEPRFGWVVRETGVALNHVPTSGDVSGALSCALFKPFGVDGPRPFEPALAMGQIEQGWIAAGDADDAGLGRRFLLDPLSQLPGGVAAGLFFGPVINS